MTIRVNVDPTNPGQYFACCGILELADRLWSGAEGVFEGREFVVQVGGDLKALVDAIRTAELIQVDLENDTSTPVLIGKPFRPFRLDWWQDERSGGKEAKVWAGTMESYRIARAMQHATKEPAFDCAGLFDIGVVAYDPDDLTKKVEPYYFDSRRCANAHSRDVGFSANDLSLTTTAFPAVELLCLVGLQRALPVTASKDRSRVFQYHTWATPIPANVLPAAVAGHVGDSRSRPYQFENWFRTGQRKHKSFRSAVSLSKKRGNS